MKDLDRAVKTFEKHKMASNLTFTWEDKNSLLKYFIEKRKNNLEKKPEIIQVMDGYDSLDVLDTFCNGDVYYVRGLVKQERVILKDTQSGRAMTIPSTFKHNFYRVKEPRDKAPPERMDDKAMTLDKILDSDYVSDDFIYVTPEHEEGTKFLIGGEDDQEETLGILEIADTYEELYLIAHTVIKGAIIDQPVSIPAYVPIEIRRATGAIEKKFRDVLDEFGKRCQTSLDKKVKLNEVIMIHEDWQKEDDKSIYQYIAPSNYLEVKLQAKQSPPPPPLPPPLRLPDPPQTGRVFKSVGDVPLDFELTVEEVADTLKFIDASLDDKKDEFMKQAIDGQFAKELDEAILTKDLGFSGLQARKFIKFVNGWRPKCNSTFVNQPKLGPDHPPLPPHRDPNLPPPLPKRDPMIKALPKVAPPSPSTKSYKNVNYAKQKDKPVPNVTAPKQTAVVQPRSTPAEPNKPRYTGQPKIEPGPTVEDMEDEESGEDDDDYEVVTPSPTTTPPTSAPSTRRVFSSVSDVPVEFDLTVEEVADTLKFIDASLEDKKDEFIKQEIDGQLAKSLDEDILTKDLGFSRLHARKFIKFANGWRAKSN